MTVDADRGPLEFDKATAFILRNWLLIGAMALLGAASGWIAAKFLPKVYRAEALVAPVTSESNSSISSLLGTYGAIAGLSGINLRSGDSSTAIVVATLKSRLFIEQFIAENELLPVLFPKLWDPVTLKWRVADGKGPTVQSGYGVMLADVLSVSENSTSGLVTVRIEWTDPVQAADWANLLVARVNEVARSREIRNAERSIEYLMKELDNTQSVEVRQSIYSLLESQVNKRMLANTRPDYAFTVIDPAQAPQIGSFIWPAPVILAAIGFFSGGLLAIVAALFAPYMLATLRRRH